jgi:UDP-N-acetylglucosamine/UDP-N-acetylgalactosamine diphosphorylase
MSGNGNGTFITAMESTGVLKKMRETGVQYFQLASVDNVLLKVADPL